MNSIDDYLRTIVAVQNAMKLQLEELTKALKSKPEDDIFISPKEAGKILGCSDDIIKQLQDVGQLTLCFKPTVPKDGKGDNQHRHRLVIRSEVLEMSKKSIAKPAKKK